MEVYTRLRTSLANGGFQLTKWIGNSENVMKVMSPEDRSGAQSKTLEAEPLGSSILGLQWNVKSDSLEICRGMGKEVAVKVTQRIVLSQVSSVPSMGIVFAGHSEDAVVAQRNLEETREIVG